MVPDCVDVGFPQVAKSHLDISLPFYYDIQHLKHFEFGESEANLMVESKENLLRGEPQPVLIILINSNINNHSNLK